MWKIKETEHYVFNYKVGSLAEKELEQIITLQEGCFKEITETLQFIPPNKIRYWLCDTRREVMEVSGLDYEANGVTYTEPENPRICAVYNEGKKCVGYHEDTHAIACQYASPNSVAIIEGLAMYFDRVWWKIPNELCTYVYIKDRKYVSIQKMIAEEDFYQIPDMVSYPIMGAFTAYIIHQYGIAAYRKLYQVQDDWKIAFKDVYGLELSGMEEKFIRFIEEQKYSKTEVKAAQETLYSN